MENDVDVMERDSLDDEHAAQFQKPWLVVLPDGAVEQYDTEDGACARQREWREAHGLDPMTGEKRRGQK